MFPDNHHLLGGLLPAVVRLHLGGDESPRLQVEQVSHTVNLFLGKSPPEELLDLGGSSGFTKTY